MDGLFRHELGWRAPSLREGESRTFQVAAQAPLPLVARLRVWKAGAEEQVDLPSDAVRCTIGAAKDNDVVLPGRPTLSQHHVELVLAHGRWYLRNLLPPRDDRGRRADLDPNRPLPRRQDPDQRLLLGHVPGGRLSRCAGRGDPPADGPLRVPDPQRDRRNQGLSLPGHRRPPRRSDLRRHRSPAHAARVSPPPGEPEGLDLLAPGGDRAGLALDPPGARRARARPARGRLLPLQRRRLGPHRSGPAPPGPRGGGQGHRVPQLREVPLVRALERGGAGGHPLEHAPRDPAPDREPRSLPQRRLHGPRRVRALDARDRSGRADRELPPPRVALRLRVGRGHRTTTSPSATSSWLRTPRPPLG